MRFLLGKSILYVLMAVLLFVIFHAARTGVADVLTGYAKNEMTAWSSSETQPDSNAVDNVRHALETARLIEPGNPEPYENLARLTLLRSGIAGTNDAVRRAFLREGMDLNRQAIALNPASPYTWATLVRLKNSLGEYDAEFHRALERSVTLGPWEPEVQSIVADAGLGAWDALPFAERELVRKNFIRGMKWQAETMMYIAQSRRKRCNGERPDCRE